MWRRPVCCQPEPVASCGYYDDEVTGAQVRMTLTTRDAGACTDVNDSGGSCQ